MTNNTPRTNTRLIGHEAAEATLMHDFESGKLAHGWLISGPRGIGKATLAYRFARTLLAGEHAADMHDEHPIFKRIVAGSHTDLLVVEQIYDEKKEEKAREISVDQAREIAQFLSLTPGESQWRVVIIDSVDALGTSGANAILKILEEPPPQTVLLLISHNPSRLLPTIRSRCRSLKLKSLEKSQFTSVMRHISPSLDSTEIRALAQLSAMSPGVALELHAQAALEIYEKILDIMSAMPTPDATSIHAFAEAMGTGKMHTNWHVFTQLVLCLLARITIHAEGIEMESISDTEYSVLHKLSKLHSPALWAAKWQQVAEQFLLIELLHLDYKQAIITFFHSIPTREGLQIGTAA